MSIEISTNAKDRSLKQVLSDVRTDASLLVRQEIALAKAELKEKATAAQPSSMKGISHVSNRRRGTRSIPSSLIVDCPTSRGYN